MTQPNRVAIALSSIFTAAASGGAVATVFVWLSWREWSFLQVFGDPRNLVFAGNFCFGPLVGFVVGWRLSPGIEETWRRAAMAVTSALGAFGAAWVAFPISMAAMMIMNPFTSQALVPGYFLLLAVIAFFAYRYGQKHRAQIA